MKIFKSGTSTKLTAEVDRLQKRKAALAAKLDAARMAETDAREAQRNHLLSDDESPETAARLAAAVTAATSDVAAIADALSTVDALIAEGRAAIVAAKESAARAKRASEIEARIRKIEPLCAEAEKTFERLVSVLEKIAAEADDDALSIREYVELRGHTDRLPVTSIIGASLAQALFRDMPDLLAVETSGAGLFANIHLPMMIERFGALSRSIPIDRGDENSFTPKKLSGALTQNIIEPLKQAASEILAGTRSIAKASTVIDGDDDAEPIFNYPWIVFVRPAIWTDWRGETVNQPDSRAMVPEPVALAAIAAGVAFPEDAPEAVAHEGRRYRQGYHSSSVSMTKDVETLDVRWPTTTREAA